MSQERPTPQTGVGESPWSKEAPAGAVLPPPPTGVPPTGTLAAPGWVIPSAGRPSPQHRSIAALKWIGVVALSATVATALTLALQSAPAARLAGPSSTAPSVSAPPAPQQSSAETASAKQNLCQVFDVSVRGQEGQGGLRVQGNLNMPVVVRALNSASAVQNALVPAVPPDVASAARKYVTATLDQTTAAMGNTPTSEGNRLTDVRNDAIDALLGVCGLPR